MSGSVDEETQIGEVYAFRQFKLSLTSKGLESTNPISRTMKMRGEDIRFHRGRNHFECRLKGHSQPDGDCTCGFYAYNEVATFNSGFMVVNAVVKLSGKVIVAQNGYRSEYMEIVALSSKSELTYGRLAKSNDPVVSSAPVFRSSEDMLHEFPLTTGYVPDSTNRRFPGTKGDKTSANGALDITFSVALFLIVALTILPTLLVAPSDILTGEFSFFAMGPSVLFAVILAFLRIMPMVVYCAGLAFCFVYSTAGSFGLVTYPAPGAFALAVSVVLGIFPIIFFPRFVKSFL